MRVPTFQHSISTLRGILIGALILFSTGCGQSTPTAPGTDIPPAPINVPPRKGQAKAAKESPQAEAAMPPANDDQAAVYDRALEQSALEKASAEVRKTFKENEVAIVVVDDVPGPAADADHYLERKLFKAAWVDYEAATNAIAAQNESIKKAAQEQALAEHRKTYGEGFGPTMVWYRYHPIDSKVPYPLVRGGRYGEGRHVYYVGSVKDLSAFSQRLHVGDISSIDQAKRTITIKSFLPSPIPDIDEEELIIQRGKENVVLIEVNGADGPPDRVSYYLEQKIQETSEFANLTLVGPRAKGAGKYRMVVAPVRDFEKFTSKLDLGNVVELDPSQRKIVLAVQIPADLPPRPSAKEIAEQQEKKRHEQNKEHEKQRVERQQRVKELISQNKKSLQGDSEPAAEENKIDWAVRILKKGDDSRAAEAALEALTSMEVDPQRLDEVADALVEFGSTSSWAWSLSDELYKAIGVWSNNSTTRFVIQKLSEHHLSTHTNLLFRTLALHPSEDGARAVARFMTDRHLAVVASNTLRDMGPVAENTVLLLAQDRFPSMRAEAYDILRAIGTKTSLTKLKSFLPKEKDQQAKEVLKGVMADLEKRLADTSPEPAKKK